MFTTLTKKSDPKLTTPTKAEAPLTMPSAPVKRARDDSDDSDEDNDEEPASKRRLFDDASSQDQTQEQEYDDDVKQDEDKKSVLFENIRQSSGTPESFTFANAIRDVAWPAGSITKEHAVVEYVLGASALATACGVDVNICFSDELYDFIRACGIDSTYLIAKLSH